MLQNPTLGDSVFLYLYKSKCLDLDLCKSKRNRTIRLTDTLRHMQLGQVYLNLIKSLATLSSFLDLNKSLTNLSSLENLDQILGTWPSPQKLGQVFEEFVKHPGFGQLCGDFVKFPKLGQVSRTLLNPRILWVAPSTMSRRLWWLSWT